MPTYMLCLQILIQWHKPLKPVPIQSRWWSGADGGLEQMVGLDYKAEATEVRLQCGQETPEWKIPTFPPDTSDNQEAEWMATISVK